jgi:hypothetical protein
MNEMELAKRFSEDVDRILKDKRAEIKPAPEDREDYLEAIDLARGLAAMDLAGQCRTAGDLRRRLLESISRPVKEQGARPEHEDAELSDDELDNVAGGINPHREFPPED